MQTAILKVTKDQTNINYFTAIKREGYTEMLSAADKTEEYLKSLGYNVEWYRIISQYWGEV